MDCIDKWLLRNNRFCPVCKRRALPGGESSSESESESGGTTRTSTTSQRVVNETRANEDEDTNESTRLLVVSQRGGGVDTDSVTSQNVSMNPNSGLATGQQSDMNSLNNHMTMSMASSATNNLASSSFNNPMMNTTNLVATSSKYGSISSINNMGSVVNEAFVKDDDVDSGGDDANKITKTVPVVQNNENERMIDSKQTPDYYTPRSGENLFPVENNDTTAATATTSNTDQANVKSKNKKKKKKSKSTINNETVSKIATELATAQQKESEDQEIVDERFHSVMDDDDKLLDDK